MAQPKKEYALYQGEKLLAIGTAKEIAEQRGIKVDSVLYLGTPSYLKRRKRTEGVMVLVKLEVEE